MRVERFTRRSVSGQRERHELVTRAGFVLVAVDVEPGQPAKWHGVAPLCVPDGTDWRIRLLALRPGHPISPQPVRGQAIPERSPHACYSSD